MIQLQLFRVQQERVKKRQEFENQKNRIVNQLEFEKCRDTRTNVQRWEKSVKEDEKELDKAKQDEQKQVAEIHSDVQELDRLKSVRAAKKEEMVNLDEDIAMVLELSISCPTSSWLI